MTSPRVGHVDELNGAGPGTAMTRRDQGIVDSLVNTGVGFDIATISDQAFDQLLERDKVLQARLQKIIESRLTPDLHYGIPKMANGRPVPGFKKPMLYQIGASALRNLFRYRPKLMGDPIVEESQEYVSVTVTIGLFDAAGRFLGSRSASCNTRERRFQRREADAAPQEIEDELDLDPTEAVPVEAPAAQGRGRRKSSAGGNWIYTDARDQLHVCMSMAEKRALVLVTRDVTGADAFFATSEEARRAVKQSQQKVWTSEERQTFYTRCKAVGIKTADECTEFVNQVIGRWPIYSGDDVAKLMSALDDYEIGIRPGQTKAQEATGAQK